MKYIKRIVIILLLVTFCFGIMFLVCRIHDIPINNIVYKISFYGLEYGIILMLTVIVAIAIIHLNKTWDD